MQQDSGSPVKCSTVLLYFIFFLSFFLYFFFCVCATSFRYLPLSLYLVPRGSSLSLQDMVKN